MKSTTATHQGTAGPVAPARGLWWVVTCTAGAAVGIAVARPVAELARAPLSQVLGGTPTIALFGALFGGCLGLGQALVRQGRSGPHPVWWVLANIMSGAVGYVAGAELASALTDPIRGRLLVYVSEVLGYLVLGAVLGLLFGVVQGGIRRASGQGTGVWWIAWSMLGWALGFVVAAGVGLLITRLPSITVRDLLFGGLTGLTAGGLEALAVARRTGV